MRPARGRPSVGPVIARACLAALLAAAVAAAGCGSSTPSYCSQRTSLSNAVKSAQFLKPLDSQTSAQFVWDLVWRFDQHAGKTALPELNVDFEYPSPGTTVPLGWCPDATYDATGAFLGYNAGLPASASDLEPDLDGVQYACVISRDAKSVNGAPDVTVSHDSVYVYGDARMGSG